MPLVKGEVSHNVKEIDLNLAKIDYGQVFTFLKQNARISKSEAKELVETIYYRATVIDMLILSELQLDNFDKAYRLLELNSRPQSVLAMILMGFAT